MVGGLHDIRRHGKYQIEVQNVSKRRPVTPIMFLSK